MATTANEYKIYCTTESTYVNGWGTTAPTTCYNNAAHSVNTNSVQLLQTISSATVTIKEDKITTNRNARVECIYFTDVASYATAEVVYSFTHPVSMYSYTFSVDDTNKNDELTIVANEGTTLGLITGNLSVAATVIGAPAALMAYGMVGYNLSLTDGTNTDDVGVIQSFDRVNNTVTVTIPTTHSFSSTNTVVKMSYYIMRNLRLSNAGVYRWFDDVIGGTPIVPSVSPIVVKFRYKNNAVYEEIDDSPKNFTVYLTILF